MKKEKEHFCFNCGESLGFYVGYHGDIDACGKPECLRAEREVHQQIQEEAQYAAEQDGYSRYGGEGW